jgi:glycosyltransferase involved in cell wall biosynthesis
MGANVTELPIGLDSRIFTPSNSSMRETLGFTKEHIVMGYVGRLNRLKGTDLLAEAFRKVVATSPQARLVIIGHGEEEGLVRYLLKEEIVSGKVHLIPGLNAVELGSWYRSMDVFVLPSRYENFSNALLEAAACGVPFIASNIGGNRMFHDAYAGQLFEPGSAEDLESQMLEFIRDAEPRKAKARHRSLTVRNRYDWKTTAERLEWILETRFGLRSGLASPQPEPNLTALQ